MFMRIQSYNIDSVSGTLTLNCLISNQMMISSKKCNIDTFYIDLSLKYLFILKGISNLHSAVTFSGLKIGTV